MRRHGELKNALQRCVIGDASDSMDNIKPESFSGDMLWLTRAPATVSAVRSTVSPCAGNNEVEGTIPPINLSPIAERFVGEGGSCES